MINTKNLTESLEKKYSGYITEDEDYFNDIEVEPDVEDSDEIEDSNELEDHDIDEHGIDENEVSPEEVVSNLENIIGEAKDVLKELRNSLDLPDEDHSEERKVFKPMTAKEHADKADNFVAKRYRQLVKASDDDFLEEELLNKTYLEQVACEGVMSVDMAKKAVLNSNNKKEI